MDGPCAGFARRDICQIPFPVDQAIRFDSDSILTAIRHILFGGDQVISVDRQLDRVGLSGLVRPAECHRCFGSQFALVG